MGVWRGAHLAEPCQRLETLHLLEPYASGAGLVAASGRHDPNRARRPSGGGANVARELTVSLQPHYPGSCELLQVFDSRPTLEVEVQLLVEAFGVVPSGFFAELLNNLACHPPVIGHLYMRYPRHDSKTGFQSLRSARHLPELGFRLH